MIENPGYALPIELYRLNVQSVRRYLKVVGSGSAGFAGARTSWELDDGGDHAPSNLSQPLSRVRAALVRESSGISWLVMHRREVDIDIFLPLYLEEAFTQQVEIYFGRH